MFKMVNQQQSGTMQRKRSEENILLLFAFGAGLVEEHLDRSLKVLVVLFVEEQSHFVGQYQPAFFLELVVCYVLTLRHRQKVQRLRSLVFEELFGNQGFQFEG